MKKNVVKIIIAVVVLILLAGGTILLKMPSKQTDANNTATATAAPTYDICKEDAANVKSVSVNSADFQMEFSKAEEDKWTVNGLPTGEVDTTKTRSAVESVIGMSSSEKIAESVSDLEQYGLANPETTVTVNKTDGTADKIYIGSKSPVNGSYFVKNDTDAVYTISSYKVEQLKNPVNYYTEFSRFTIKDASEIHGITIERSDVTIKLSEGEATENQVYSNWIMTSPINTQASSDYISNSILQNMTEINLSAPLENGNYGFDKPSAKIILNMKTDENEHTEELVLGKKSEGNIYVQYNGKAYSQPANLFEFAQAQPLSFISKVQSLINISGVEKVEISGEGVSHTIDIAHSGGEDDELTFKLDGKDIDESTAKKLYQEIIGIQIDGMYDNRPVGASLLTLKYKGYNGAEDMTVEFKAIDDLDCAFVKNGEIQFTVKRSVINTLIGTINSYAENN